MGERSAVNSRDLRVQRTYKLLKDAFMGLLKEKTFEQITVQEICEEAMVRRTTFYQHFEDKQDFLNWFIREKRHEFTESSAGEVSPENLDAYYGQVIRNVLQYLSDNEQIVRLLLDAGVQGRLLLDAFSAACVEEVTKKLESTPHLEGRLGDVPPAFLAEFYIGGVVAAARWWFSQGKPCSEEKMADYIRWAITRGNEK